MHSAQVFVVTVHGAQVLRELCIALEYLGNFSGYSGICGKLCKAFGYFEDYKECSSIWENCVGQSGM